MNELHAILDAWRGAQDADRSSVLATVVHVEGSAYRRPGSRMLILPDGRHVGGVSGGCLEGELIRKAWWFTEAEVPVMRVYDTTSDDDAVWEFGLGCNGIVHVMLERAGSPAAVQMLEFLDVHRISRRPAVIATVTHCNASGITAGQRLLIDERFSAEGELRHSRLADPIMEHAKSVFGMRRSQLVHFPEGDVFVELVAPPAELVIFGAGHDVVPLVSIASELGWDVTVADGRASHARPERFPGARRVLTIPGDDPLRGLQIGQEAAVVVMTHNIVMDMRLVPRILDRHPRYLGILGPKMRAEKLFGQLGMPIPANVHVPIGLDIGCDTPQTIALSVAAEIQASISGRSGEKLMFRNRAIHAPAFEIGERELQETAEATRPDYCEVTVGSHG